MAPSDAHQPRGPRDVRTSRLARGALGVAALWLWVGVGSYAWPRATLATRYTVAVVGGAVCLALIVSLLGDASPHDAGSSTADRRRSRLDRLVVAGSLVAVGGGTLGVWGAVDQLAASQPQPESTAVAAGAAVVGGLIVLVARRTPVAAGLAVAAIVGAAASAPDVAIIETMVFDDGLYGSLTQAAVTWIAPLCLLAGLWRVTDTDRKLAAIAGWVDHHGQLTAVGRQCSRYAAALAAIAVLSWWQTDGRGSVAVAGLLTVAGVGVVGMWTTDSRPAGLRRAQTRLGSIDWREPLVMVGGPLMLMALLGGGYRLPMGTVLVAGCLCCLGCCVARPAVVETTSFPTAVRTALEGSIAGMRLLVRVVVPLAIAGGVVAVLDATALSLELLSAVVWLSGGYWPTAAAIVVAGSMLVGRAVPLIAAYAVGTLLAVPILLLSTPVAELTAYVVVAAAVVAGSLLSVDPPRL